MPQASDELRAQWPGGDRQAIDHLEAKGFIPTKDFCWIRPHKYYQPTNRDNSAITYLIDEYDYGDIVEKGVSLTDHAIRAPSKPHYKRPHLTTREQYFLALLAEECSEVIKLAAGKTVRFGYRIPGKNHEDGEPDFTSTPEYELHNEAGDVLAALEFCYRCGILERSRVEQARNKKIEKLLTETDNLGRPLTPRLPDLPIHGPDGSVWEDGKEFVRNFVSIRHDVAIMEDFKLRFDYDKMTQKPPSLRQRITAWFKSSETDKDFF